MTSGSGRFVLLAGTAIAMAAVFGGVSASADDAQVIADAKAAVAKYAGPQTDVGGTDLRAEAGGRKEGRLSVRRRAERHLPSLWRLHQGSRRESRLGRHHHRRQGQPHLVARRHEPGDRAEAGRHRPLRRCRQPAGPDQGRRRAGHQLRRPPRRRLSRPAARHQPLRQHPGGPARDRQGRGGLGHRRFERHRAGSSFSATTSMPSPKSNRWRPRPRSRNAPAAKCSNTSTRRPPRRRSASRS